MPYAVNELFGYYTNGREFPDLTDALATQACPYRRTGLCFKGRKSEPEKKIGSCSVCYGRVGQPILICPDRLTEGKKIFIDCLQYLNPTGGELYLIPEVSTAVGSIDYVLAVISSGRVRDFVAIELQTLDTTGQVWDSRQEMLADQGYVPPLDHRKKGFAINWKMTAKTILAQMIQKSQMFDAMGRKLVLICQTPLLDYMARTFDFTEVHQQRPSDVFNIHAYDYVEYDGGMHLALAHQLSSDIRGVERIMGTGVDNNTELAAINARILERAMPEFRFAPFV